MKPLRLLPMTAFAVAATLNTAQAENFSQHAIDVGQRVLDACNDVILEPSVNGVTRDEDIKKCMKLVFDETRAYAGSYVQAFGLVQPHGTQEGFEYGIAKMKLAEHCTLQFTLDTTAIKDAKQNILHNTDVTNDCLYYVFEANARFPTAAYDEGVHMTLANATNCVAEIAGKWVGACKKTNTSPLTPRPFQP